MTRLRDAVTNVRMTPTLQNKLALIATLAEEEIEHQRLNNQHDRIDRDTETALDDEEVQQFLLERRRIGAVRSKRPATRSR